MDAMLDAAVGEEAMPYLPFCMKVRGVAAEQEQKKKRNEADSDGGHITDHDKKKNKTRVAEEEDPETTECPECGEDPCVFNTKNYFVAYDDASTAQKLKPLPQQSCTGSLSCSTQSVGRRSSEAIAELLCLGNQRYVTPLMFWLKVRLKIG
jgi:hypothetical protein